MLEFYLIAHCHSHSHAINYSENNCKTKYTLLFNLKKNITYWFWYWSGLYLTHRFSWSIRLKFEFIAAWGNEVSIYSHWRCRLSLSLIVTKLEKKTLFNSNILISFYLFINQSKNNNNNMNNSRERLKEYNYKSMIYTWMYFIWYVFECQQWEWIWNSVLFQEETLQI